MAGPGSTAGWSPRALWRFTSPSARPTRSASSSCRSPRSLGITKPIPGDWTRPQLGWIFTIAIVFLGTSAALFGRWLERAGPRKSGMVAALCWCAGFLVGAPASALHQLWLLYLGYGVLGGCGLGLGYITPVSTLIKWFPDRRGMATGMAIMGFGGGAMIACAAGRPADEALRDRRPRVGVGETFVPGPPLLRRHDGRRVPVPGPAAGLDAARAGSTPPRAALRPHDHPP